MVFIRRRTNEERFWQDYTQYKTNGLPKPGIELSSGGISVTIYKNIYNEKNLKNLGLNDRQIKVIVNKMRKYKAKYFKY